MTNPRSLISGALALAAVGLLASGCSLLSSAAVTRPGAHVVTVTRGEHRVVVVVGQRVDVELSSTYWEIGSGSNAAVLAAQGDESVRARLAGCVPGEGCGTASRAFLATAPGTATVLASRTTCGEALLCTGGQGHYSLTVVVRAAAS